MEEMLEIIDKNGNPTGEIVEKFEAKRKNLLFKVIALFIINSNNQVLIQKRSSLKKINPSKWGICEGHVGVGETTEMATIRELKEELDIDANSDEIIPICNVLKERESNSNITYAYYMYLDKDIKDFVLQEEELSEVKWLDFKEYKDLVANNDPSVAFSNNASNMEMLNKLEQILFSRR